MNVTCEEHEDCTEKVFRVTYALPHAIEVISMVRGADLGSVNMQWRRHYRDNSFMTIRYDGGIRVFHARDVLLTTIEEV